MREIYEDTYIEHSRVRLRGNPRPQRDGVVARGGNIVVSFGRDSSRMVRLALCTQLCIFTLQFNLARKTLTPFNTGYITSGAILVDTSVETFDTTMFKFALQTETQTKSA